MRIKISFTPCLAALALAAIACEGASPATGEKTIRVAQPIQGGTVDQSDSNVVGILIGDGSGMVSAACSGSLIGPNLVLTAHHCVANPPNNLVCGGQFSAAITPASYFMVTTSYNAAYDIWTGSGVMPTADGITWWGVSSITVPSVNDICGGDMAALTLSSSITGVCPLIPAVDVQPADNSTYTAIGFGITSPNGNTAGERYKVTGMTVQCFGSADCKDTTISATAEWEGGSTAQKGTCEGDSGGPALDSLNRVIGSVSRGPSNACNSTVYESTYGDAMWLEQVAKAAATAGGYTVAGWATGGATSNPSSGYPCSSTSGGDAGAGGNDAGTGTGGDAGTGSGGVPTTCGGADGNEGCCVGGTLYYCTNGTGSVMSVDCTQMSGDTCGWSAASGYYDCVPSPGGADPSGMYQEACPVPATPDAGAAGDGGAVNDGGASTDDAGGSGTDDAGMGTVADSGGSSTPDAGAADAGLAPSEDASTGGGSDASAGSDGASASNADSGSGAGSESNSSGCSCTVVHSNDADLSGLAWLGAGIALWGARARRRRTR